MSRTLQQVLWIKYLLRAGSSERLYVGALVGGWFVPRRPQPAQQLLLVVVVVECELASPSVCL